MTITSERRIQHGALRDFAAAMLLAAGAEAGEAARTADILVWTDLVGRSSQGVWRLKELVPKLREGLIRSPCTPDFNETAPGVVLVDGHDGLGRYLGHAAMERAVGLARNAGLGLAAVRNSSHFGASAYYVEMAARAGMIGLAFTNTPRRVAAHGGATPVLGTNPIGFGAPMRNGESVLVDFSTSAMAGSVIRKGSEANQAIPPGVAIDLQGNAVTEAGASGFTMLPFAGAKGYCLSLLTEIMAAVLTGGVMSFEMPNMFENVKIQARTGHAFLGVDIAKFMPLEAYYERMDRLIGMLKGSTLQPGFDEVLIPGETRWRNYHAQMEEGILLEQQTMGTLKALAAEMGVNAPW